MPFRIELSETPSALVIDFHGVLDVAALAEVSAIVRRNPGQHVSLVLEVGTEVDPECIAPLRRLGAAIRAESPFLALWLRSG